MFERILEQNCQTFDNFNFEFSMSHHNAHYQPYKKAPLALSARRPFGQDDQDCREHHHHNHHSSATYNENWMSAALAAATETVRLQLAFSVPQTELFVFSPPAPETCCDLKSILGFQKHFPDCGRHRGGQHQWRQRLQAYKSRSWFLVGPLWKSNINSWQHACVGE